MKQFLWNLVLALTWMCLWGKLSVPIFAAGYALGFVLLFLTKTGIETKKYLRKTVLWIRFMLYFAWEFLASALRIARDVLTYRPKMQPGVLAVPLDADTDAEILFLANVISLTPGTLSLDISDDRKTLYVHFMYLNRRDIEASRHEIKIKFERKIMELFA